MNDLRITLVQTSLLWEEAEKNRMHFTSVLKDLNPGATDLIILPEMFTTGFTMNAGHVAEEMSGPTVSWMKQMTASKKAVICASIVIRESGKYFNRLVWMRPDGSYDTYDKRHLFRMADEHTVYSGGDKRIVVSLNEWRICPLVCYDLRFPAWSRNQDEYDLLIYVANWPEKRKFAWSQLLIARAIENQCYVAGVNRVGLDGKNIEYSGDSVVLDPMGTKISSIKPGTSQVETIVLNGPQLVELRKTFPVMMDRDFFRIK